MKRCPYCGREHSDDATECEIDQTPLDEEVQRLESVPKGAPRFGIFSEYRIPVSLLVVSYLFFLPAATCFAFIAFIVICLFLSSPSAVSDFLFPACAIAMGIGIFFVCLSRGLRRCSRGWRIAALVFIWLGFIEMMVYIGKYIVTQKTPRHETAMEFWLELALSFLLLLWEYRVLTRPDIRDLFYK
jgi:hypothetical protein